MNAFSNPLSVKIMHGPYVEAKRSRKDTRDPCAICGWAKHMAIHQPMTSGPRMGQPFGHAYQPKPQDRPTVSGDAPHEH